MGQIKVSRCPIEGLYIIEPTLHRDARGYFMETYNQKDMQESGLYMNFVQDNQSMSEKGVLRGMHYQKNHPQGKLIRIIRGSVYDVAVDIRRESKTFAQWYGVELTEENKKEFYIPEGFAHGFLVLSDMAEICYKVTDFHYPDDECGLLWDDPEIGIQWPQLAESCSETENGIKKYRMRDGTELKLSDRDQKWLTLKDIINNN